MKQELTLAEVLAAAHEAAAHRLHTVLPGKVLQVYADTRRVDVQLVFRGFYRTEEGDLVDEQLPMIPHVPIGFLRAGGLRIEVPVKVGDWVTLLFYEWNIGEWLAGGQTDISPGDVERHGLTGAVALPILFPDNEPVGEDFDGTHIVLGDASDFIALAGKTDAGFAALKAAILAALGAITAPGGGPATLTAFNNALTTLPIPATASTKVKAG